MVIVPKPRSGQPKALCNVTNSSSADRPNITSGITKGIDVKAVNSVRPRNRPSRVNAKAASVPTITAKLAERVATIKEFLAAAINASLLNNSPYQRVEKPPQTDIILFALNE